MKRTGQAILKLRNDHFEIAIDRRARLAAVTGRETGKNHCPRPSPFWSVRVNRQEYPATSLSVSGQQLDVLFGNVARARFRFETCRDYFVLELLSVLPREVTGITLARLALKKLERLAFTLNACYDDKDAFCVMALDPPVRCAPEEAGGAPLAEGTGTADRGALALSAGCFSRQGMAGNRVALIACPADRFRAVIAAVESARGLPCATLDGSWARDSGAVRRSYLFIRDLDEGNCDRVIACARKMNAGAILLMESWCGAISGHYPLNRALFPGGLPGLEKVAGKIRRAGMRAGLHLLVTGASAGDRYLGPLPDRRLFKDGAVTLAADIGREATRVPCLERPSAFPEKLELTGRTVPHGTMDFGIYRSRGVEIQVDDEIITYGRRSPRPPYFFTGCVRGACGTRPAAHRRGARVYHLKRAYGLYVTDLDTGIGEEIAARTARLFNRCGFDMIYLDGAENLQGEAGDHWYYNAKIVKAFHDAIAPGRPGGVLFQASSCSHYSWHVISRAACADGFVNIRDNINNAMGRFPDRIANMIPLDIGWYDPVGPSTSPGDVEYILCRSIGWDSSCGFQAGLAQLEENPGILEMIGNYEKLRIDGYFPESVRAGLRRRVARRLALTPGGRWVFRQA